MQTYTSEELLEAYFVAPEPSYAGMILLLSLTAVVLLYLGFKRYKDVLVDVKNRRRAKELVDEIESDLASFPGNILAGSEEYAAIATVIHLYHNELHDEEVAIMTINKIARAYSPWCAKAHFMNQYFNLRRR